MGGAEETINTLLGAMIFFWANPLPFCKKNLLFHKILRFLKNN
jgi:hypothetical protein